jgi:hypothetical protein
MIVEDRKDEVDVLEGILCDEFRQSRIVDTEVKK